MRILFSAHPGAGHIFPLLPLARAFRERGDSAAMLTAGAMAPLVAPEGIELLPAGPTGDVIVAEVLRTTGHDLWQGTTAEAEADYFAAVRVDLSIDEALAAARTWQPDLIVADYFDFVGTLTGAVLDVPVATLAYAPALQPRTIELVAVHLRTRYEERGVVYGPARWYLDTCPPALQFPDWEAPEGWIGIRPEPHRNPGQVLPAKGERGNRRPRVLLSFGTVYSSPQVISALLREVLAQDVDVRITLGGASPEEFSVDADKADRLEFVGFTPFAELLRDVDVVLTHGGAGSALGALAEGIPMVVVPQNADQPIQAERVAAAGAGISFPLGEATPEAVAEAVRKVLTEHTYRDVAEKIAAQIASLDSPADVAERLASAISR